MPTVETRATSRLSVSDLAPLRRMLGSHSLVIRVNADGTLMPFEILPELFLGRPIRQLLAAGVREQFEDACSQVASDLTARTFVPEGFDDMDEVMINPVLDDDGTRCQFLVCWARRQGEDADAPVGVASLSWADLDPADIEVRFRARKAGQIEAAPWWNVGVDGIDLWAHHHRVSSVGLGQMTMADVVTEGIAMLAAHDDIGLRIEVPSAEMLDGLLQVFYGAIRTTGVDAERIEVGVPVELAVDPDLLPLIAHLRTLGLHIDIVGLDALTAKLHTVSDTSDHRHVLPIVAPPTAGDWVADVADAIQDAAA